MTEKHKAENNSTSTVIFPNTNKAVKNTAKEIQKHPGNEIIKEKCLFQDKTF